MGGEGEGLRRRPQKSSGAEKERKGKKAIIRTFKGNRKSSALSGVRVIEDKII